MYAQRPCSADTCDSFSCLLHTGIIFIAVSPIRTVCISSTFIYLWILLSALLSSRNQSVMMIMVCFSSHIFIALFLCVRIYHTHTHTHTYTQVWPKASVEVGEVAVLRSIDALCKEYFITLFTTCNAFCERPQHNVSGVLIS